MGFHLGEDEDSGINEMNLIPLIDIMLVLMIIFLVTATVANPSIPLSLPKTTAELQDAPPKVVTLSIDAAGQIAWDGQALDLPQLTARLQQVANSGQAPTLQIRADKNAKYDTVAQVMSRASSAGLTDLAFVTDN